MLSTTFTLREQDGVTVINVKGRLALGDGTGLLWQMIDDVLRRGSARLLLDLAHVSHIDSSGLGVLIAGYSRVAQIGGQMKLVNLSSQVVGTMQVTTLYTVFEVFDDLG